MQSGGGYATIQEDVTILSYADCLPVFLYLGRTGAITVTEKKGGLKYGRNDERRSIHGTQKDGSF